jgi:hypothetical protein
MDHLCRTVLMRHEDIGANGLIVRTLDVPHAVEPECPTT